MILKNIIKFLFIIKEITICANKWAFVKLQGNLEEGMCAII